MYNCTDTFSLNITYTPPKGQRIIQHKNLCFKIAICSEKQKYRYHDKRCFQS